MSEEKPVVVMISGPQWVSRDYYIEHYGQALLDWAKDGAHFVLGAADGIDAFAQQDLALMCRKNFIDGSRVTIFNKGEKDGRAHPDFELRNGFGSYPERDRAMCDAASVLLCKLPQYGGASGGTALNVLRMAFGGDEELALIAHTALRAHSERFSAEQKQIVMPHVEAAYDEVYE